MIRASGQAMVNRKEDRPANRELRPITHTWHARQHALPHSDTSLPDNDRPRDWMVRDCRNPEQTSGRSSVPVAKPWSTERKIAPRTVNRDQSHTPGMPGTTHSRTMTRSNGAPRQKSAFGTTYTSYTSSTAGTKPLVRSYDGMLVNILFSH